MAAQSHIRNFCIIAHIDHGKSTLADRLLEITGTVEKRKMQEQLLDSMDIERERGITIKLAPVRMRVQFPISNFQFPIKSQIFNDEKAYILNLIDTPGHVDFTYEVSRSLAAVEGAVLLVDATQGVQAQTIGNLYLAIEQNLTIIPVVNKIDLPNAEVEKAKAELVHLIGCKEEEILCVSGKTGQGVPELLRAIVERVPPPPGAVISTEATKGSAVEKSHAMQMVSARHAEGVRSLDSARDDESRVPLRALVFDSTYDTYRGVVAYVRVVDGSVKKGDKVVFMATKSQGEVLEVGYFTPKLVACEGLAEGEMGYIVSGLRDLGGCRVGDTVTGVRDQVSGVRIEPLPGYTEVKPMVFAGLFPKEGDEYSQLREAIEKLKLNDASLSFEPEHSTALGLGFRCGFLGLLHLEIVEERLRREHGIELITTVPSVAYRVTKTKGEVIVIKGAQELPDPTYIKQIEEPWVKVDIVCPKKYIGGVMQLVQEKRGVYENTEYLLGGHLGATEHDSTRVILHYELPLASILVDFYDKLKSASSGYASLNYELTGYREADVVRLDILVAEDLVEALAVIVYRDSAADSGRRIVEALKNTIPRHQFDIKIQAALGGKIVASERIAPFRKDVTAKLYGGDVTRKMKLLEKQKRGKKKMMARLSNSSVEIPSEAYLAVLKR